ncbi:diguanylate cyclase [Paenibacillus sp. GD4]|uniref:diguanylate cyclase n=1 Tax=Paenibacillus sp. GD4 TaxID=3068890 RepID=UPI002796429F|nr:diguanylate cyclase [Paenibacillus sp. GD4]MDQ1910318.1 diguanylate cyclase [Paenibacillus sp. GD4]
MKKLRHASEEERIEREARLLKEGRKRYIAVLHKQLAELQELHQLQVADDALQYARRIHRLVHTLKGSAPMFGFERIGTLGQACVKVWQWTEEKLEENSSAEALLKKYALSIEASLPIVQELEMETDIYTRELELDEHQVFTMTAPSGERLLIIDDDEVLRSYLVRLLKLDGYTVDEAADVETAERLLREHVYHLITLDLMMHPQSGYELFEQLKEDPTLKWIPLIVISGRSDVNDKVRCFHLGADDYVSKPFQYRELSARIYSLLKRTKTFEQMAFRDPLTGVYNRRYFDHQIQAELQRISRYPAPISLGFIDIDRFKSINDTYGHHIGDLVLQGLAHMLQHHLRATDLVARFGGEEFVVVLPNTHASDARKTLEHILQLTNQGPVAQYEGQAFHITFSAGVSEWMPGMSVQQWIERSDAAMYDAKQTGRNRVLVKDNRPVAAVAESTASIELRKTVLIADDDKILRSILIAKLKHLPVDFLEATNGEEALRILKDKPVDLTVLDGVMPRMDGFGVLERLQESRTRSVDTKILMLSGRTREDDVSRGLQLGAHAFMHKPFSMVEMELKVKELLDLPS